MSPKHPPVVAIVPAAGRSRRMRGEDKLLAPLGGRPLLLRFLDVLAESDIDGIMLVTRTEIAQHLRSALSRQEASFSSARAGGNRLRVIHNDDPNSEMIDSIRAGLNLIGAAEGEWPAPGILVCPADHALLTAGDVNACVSAFGAQPISIVVAVRDGRPGHPIVFPWIDAEFVLSPACDAGLRELPRRYPDRVRHVSVGSGAICDVDTPEDLERLRREFVEGVGE